jgi:hypothetical protein
MSRTQEQSVAKHPTLTTDSGMPVSDNQNSITAGPRGPVLMQDFILFEKLAHQNRERIPERGQHAKGSGAYGALTITRDISKYTSKIALAVALFAATSSAALAQGFAGANAPARMEQATNAAYQSTPVRLHRRGGAAGSDEYQYRGVGGGGAVSGGYTDDPGNYTGKEDWFDVDRNDRASTPYMGGH